MLSTPPRSAALKALGSVIFGCLLGCADRPAGARPGDAGGDGPDDPPSEPAFYDARDDASFVLDLGAPGGGQWPAGPLPAPWQVSRIRAMPTPEADAGEPDAPAEEDTATEPSGALGEGDSFALTADGAGMPITGGRDDFLFVHRPLTGDGAIVALARTAGRCPAGRIDFGVMLRTSVTDDASYGMASVTGVQGGATLMSRASSGWFSNVLRFEASVPLPLWLKVERHGARLRIGYSRDGQTWIEAERDLYDAPLTLEAGLVAASHDRMTCAVLFERVALLGAAAQGP